MLHVENICVSINTANRTILERIVGRSNGPFISSWIAGDTLCGIHGLVSVREETLIYPHSWNDAHQMASLLEQENFLTESRHMRAAAYVFAMVEHANRP